VNSAPVTANESREVTGFGAAPSGAELVQRAIGLRPELLEGQAGAEDLTYYSEETHRKFLQARFYDMFVPKRYGGLEVSPRVFFDVVKELARGDLGTAWCFTLAANHALQVASWFPEEVQDRVFADGDFRAASVSAPTVKARRADGGYLLDGVVDYCSGIPYATYFLGQAMVEREDGTPPRMGMYLAPRSAFERLRNWGDSLGLKATGSESIRFTGAFLDSSMVLEDADMINFPVKGGTVGSRLHGNPLYAGRGLVTFTTSLAALAVGGGFLALDEYERLMRTRKTPYLPIVPRIEDADYQRLYGACFTKLRTAEAALNGVIAEHMEYCRQTADDTREYTFLDDWSLAGVVREVVIGVWETVENDLLRTVGASTMRHGERFERVFRDLAMLLVHRNPMLREQAFRRTARLVLGIEES
jgi:alkylation response protein AidB-like acyl-CoA dehydrogenase